MSDVRPVRIENNVVYVPLTQGYEAVVDIQDLHIVKGYNWYAKRAIDTSAIYAVRSWMGGPARRKKKLLMHREIIQAPLGLHIDHIDRNGLNNRRHNLRVATSSENQCNRVKSANNTSGFKGVSWNKRQKQWTAYIVKNRVRIHLGVFSSIDAAHQAYCAASRMIHGEFSRT